MIINKTMFNIVFFMISIGCDSMIEKTFKINCNEGSVELSPKELLFLKCYKASVTMEEIEDIFGEDMNLFEKTMISSILNYSNMNMFSNFICNPSKELMDECIIKKVDLMIEVIKSIIDISCKFALANGSISNNTFRCENKNNRVSYYKNDFLDTPKSTSLSSRSSYSLFGKENTYFIKYQLDEVCPYFDMEKIPVGMMDGELEILLPPFLHITNTMDCEDIFIDNIGYVHTDIINVDCNFINEENIEISQEKIEYASKKIEEYYSSGNEELSEDVISNIKCVYLYLKNYAEKKYKEFSKLYKDKYTFTTNLTWDEKQKGLEQAIKKIITLPINTSIKKFGFDGLGMIYLIKRGFISYEIIKESYDKNDPYIVGNYLKQRDDIEEFDSLTDEEYERFLELFYNSAGFLKKDKNFQNDCLNELKELNFINNLKKLN